MPYPSTASRIFNTAPSIAAAREEAARLCGGECPGRYVFPDGSVLIFSATSMEYRNLLITGNK